MDKNYTVEELAKEWKVSDRTVRRLIEDQKLEAMKIGKLYRVRDQVKSAYEQKKLSK